MGLLLTACYAAVLLVMVGRFHRTSRMVGMLRFPVARATVPWRVAMNFT